MCRDKIKNQESRTKNQESRIKNQESRTKIPVFLFYQAMSLID